MRRSLLYIVLIAAALTPGLLHAAGIERIELRVEGMT